MCGCVCLCVWVCLSLCVCLCVMLVKLLEKCAFYVGGVGRQGLLRTITIAADCRFHLKHLLVLFEKKKMQAKKYVFFKLYSKVSVWIVNGTLGCLSFC